jgi:hypothetical protein
MKGMRARAALGLLLIAAGVLFLLQNLGILEQAGSLFWTLAFIVAGGVFMYIYLSDRSLWWAPIPGFSLLGIGGLIAISTYLPQYADVFGAPLLLTGISLSFWIIYFSKREQWWAIIPGGVLLSTAVFVGLDALIGGEGVLGVFFIGMGLTFLLLTRLPTARDMQWMKWAYVPAAVLLIIGAIFIVTEVSYLQIVGSVALLIVGLYLLIRTLRAKE